MSKTAKSDKVSNIDPEVITEGVIRVREGGAVRIRDKSMLEPQAVSGKKRSGSSSGSSSSAGR